MEELVPTPNICTYWPNNPAFDPKRVVLRRLFFIKRAGPNTCLLVSTRHVTIYHSSSLGFYGGLGGPKTLILGDEQVDALAEILPTLRGDV